MTDANELKEDIERLFEEGASANRERARAVFGRLREELSAGRVRVTWAWASMMGPA